ncbi:unnamed protein product [Rotaria sp. Silwood1]|nr:unnamed protein product [Rotaria sp. Silwood1]CAF1086742.1 unnamed protein product [Rotaria sp. Silwood1]CAF1109165.1 unnamed protein product [Rotaria sp. Silwood1]
MSMEMSNLNRINIQKNDGERITFRFQDNSSVADIDVALRNTLSISNNQKYSISYKDKDTGQDIYIAANGSMLRECLTENINQLNVFVAPSTSAPLPSSSSSHSKSDEGTELVQRWPELMKIIDRRIHRWTSRSDNTVDKNINNSYECLLETNHLHTTSRPGESIY